jgi:hypothetical protein
MKFTVSTIALVAASSVAAMPARRDNGPSDTDILNYALTLGTCVLCLKSLDQSVISLLRALGKRFLQGGAPKVRRQCL